MYHSSSGASISAAALAFAGALALAGCGDPPKPIPGVGHPNPNGTGILHADSGKTPATTRSNAQRQDIHSFKELNNIVNINKCKTIGDYEKVFGTPKIALQGPYAGHAIIPNVYFDGWFVESLLLESQGDIDIRREIETGSDWRTLYVYHKEIPFIRPENADWFTDPAAKGP